MQTDYERNTEQTCASLPYGDGEICTPTPSEFLYAGLQRDAESGLDHADYRQYSSTFGQWTAPDPYNGSYSWSNPQSLNRYGYVGGNPLAMVDPSGLDPVYGCQSILVSALDPLTEVGTPILSCGLQGALQTTESVTVVDSFSTTSALSLSLSWLGAIAPYAELGLEIYDFSKSIGLFGESSPFHGNIAASQAGKNVPSTGALNVPGPSAPNNGTPWYSTCTGQALLKGAGSTALDAVGLIPEGGAVAGAFSLWNGAAGISNGTKLLQGVKVGAAIVSTAYAGSDASGGSGAFSVAGAQAFTGVASVGASLARATPVVGQVLSGLAVAEDLYGTYKAVANCQ